MLCRAYYAYYGGYVDRNLYEIGGSIEVSAVRMPVVLIRQCASVLLPRYSGYPRNCDGISRDHVARRNSLRWIYTRIYTMVIYEYC